MPGDAGSIMQTWGTHHADKRGREAISAPENTTKCDKVSLPLLLEDRLIFETEPPEESAPLVPWRKMLRTKRHLTIAKVIRNDENHQT